MGGVRRVLKTGKSNFKNKQKITDSSKQQENVRLNIRQNPTRSLQMRTNVRDKKESSKESTNEGALGLFLYDYKKRLLDAQ